MTAYAGSIGRRILRLPAWSDPVTSPDSAQTLTLRAAHCLDPGLPLRPQLGRAEPVDRGPVVAALTSRPGDAEVAVRAELYRLLGLDQPAPGLSGPMPSREPLLRRVAAIQPTVH